MEDLGNFELNSENGTKKIKIAQFTDIHHFPSTVKHFEAKRRVVDMEKEDYSTQKNIELIEHVADVNEDIDLAIFTGDILDGRPHKDMEVNSFIASITELIEPLNARNIPWIFLPGNHDDDGSPWKREDLLQVFKLPGCLTPSALNFNFTLTVSKENSKRLRLWVFDSGGNHEDPKVMYETFEEETVKEFVKLSSRKKSDNEYSKGLVYFHIPLPEYGGLTPVAGVNGLFSAAVSGGLVPWFLNHSFGYSLIRLLGMDRVVGSSKLNSGIFNKFVESNRVLATFCGHE